MAKISKAKLFEEQNKLTKKTFEAIDEHRKKVKKVEDDAMKKIKKVSSIEAVDIILNNCKSDVQKLNEEYRKNLAELTTAVTINIKKIDDL